MVFLKIHSKHCVLLILVCFNFSLVAQEDEAYLQPTFTVSTKGNGIYSTTNSMEIRNFIFNKGIWKLKTRHVDLIHFSNFDISHNKKLTVGLLYRFNDLFDKSSFDEIRPSQQLSISHKTRALRYIFRSRLEQRIRKGRNLTVRLRLRHSLDFPLNGQKLDIGEQYFLAQTETVMSFTKGKQVQYDQRTTIGIGKFVNSKLKLQFGLQHRLVDISKVPSHQLFFLLSSYLSL